MRCIKCDNFINDKFLYCPFCGKKQTHQTVLIPGRDYPLPRRTKGTGSIRYLGDNRSRPYQARIVKNGVSMSLGTFETLSAAQAILNRFDPAMVSERFNATLGDIWRSYTESSAYRKLTDKGQEGMDTAWSRLQVLSSCKMRDLKRSDYQKIIDTAMKKPRYVIRTKEQLAKMQPADVERYKKLISQPPEPLGYAGKHKIQILISILCQEAMGDDIIDTNYGELLSLKTDEEKVQRRNFTEEEIEKLFVAAHQDENPKLRLGARLILIYVYTGFRANELLRLPRANVDLENHLMRGGSKTKAGKNRPIPIHERIYPFIEEMMQQKTKQTLLVLENNRTITYDHFVDVLFYPALDKLDINYLDEAGNRTLTPHRTRHTFTQLSVENGVKPDALKKIMGHTKISTTIDKYDEVENTKYLVGELGKI